MFWCGEVTLAALHVVMPALVAGIHVFAPAEKKT
jgi:hypothetical protein